MMIFFLVTVVFTVLIAIAVVFKRHQRVVHVVLSLGLLATASVLFGDVMSTYMPQSMIQWKRVVFISEAVMATAWLFFSFIFARSDYRHGVSRLSRLFIYLSPLIIIVSVAIPMNEFFYSPEFASEKILFLADGGYLFNLMLLMYSILSIINLEATLKSSQGKGRGEIKHTIMGSGAILAINIFYYSHALLYRSIHMYLLPVRTGVILVAVLLIGFSLFRQRAMDTEFTVSRKVLYRSVSLVIVSIYLLVLGLIGEGLRYLGPETGKNITTFLGFVGAILVLNIIFSEQLRGKAIVYINKHFFRQKYDYREQWLQFTQRVSLKHSFDDLLGSIADLFKDAIGVKGASVWLKEKGSDVYFCAKASEAPLVQVRPGRELIEFLRKRKWVLNRHHDKCREIVLLSEEFINVTEASLIVPLFTLDDLAGFIILQEGIADNDYNYEDYDLLKTLAQQTTVLIQNVRLMEALTEAKEMEAVGRLSSFILHDLKNTTSMLSLIVQNAEDHIDNPEFQRDAIKAISNTSEKMKNIIAKLKNLPRKSSLELEYADLGFVVRSVIEQIDTKGNEAMTFRELATVKTRFDREEITKVIINLLINAFDATGHRGRIEVAVGAENGLGYVRVSDNGCGMSEQFIEKSLFKPFQSTKKKGLGIGLYQCRAIVEAHSGTLKVMSRQGIGTDFFLYLPVVQ